MGPSHSDISYRNCTPFALNQSGRLIQSSRSCEAPCIRFSRYAHKCRLTVAVHLSQKLLKVLRSSMYSLLTCPSSLPRRIMNSDSYRELFEPAPQHMQLRQKKRPEAFLGAGSAQVSKFASHIKNLLPWLTRCKATSFRLSSPHVTCLCTLLPQHRIQKRPLSGLSFCIRCWGAGSNRRPLPLQGNALPTELPQHLNVTIVPFLLGLMQLDTVRNGHCYAKR